ncbi:basic salivary proline-rich protein 4-like [Ammospiza nelsoni]|uniref:basic salivary proline-rich protein 4-like n=1 Tax=Ammospiza nelsoni TaxID=2857394 RepID=UPI00286C1B5C|nr:basic salivary proline-rich protein 4-like [Ammospiza nelsoni]
MAGGSARSARSPRGRSRPEPPERPQLRPRLTGLGSAPPSSAAALARLRRTERARGRSHGGSGIGPSNRILRDGIRDRSQQPHPEGRDRGSIPATASCGTGSGIDPNNRILRAGIGDRSQQPHPEGRRDRGSIPGSGIDPNNRILRDGIRDRSQQQHPEERDRRWIPTHPEEWDRISVPTGNGHTLRDGIDPNRHIPRELSYSKQIDQQGMEFLPPKSQVPAYCSRFLPGKAPLGPATAPGSGPSARSAPQRAGAACAGRAPPHRQPMGGRGGPSPPAPQPMRSPRPAEPPER